MKKLAHPALKDGAKNKNSLYLICIKIMLKKLSNWQLMFLSWQFPDKNHKNSLPVYDFNLRTYTDEVFKMNSGIQEDRILKEKLLKFL